METGAEDKNQQTAIYVMTHKAFTPPLDPLYIPLHVGRAAASSYSRDEKSSPLSFCVGDNTGVTEVSLIIPEIIFPKKTVITVN
mgnify:CR=1 FL=1